MTDEVAIVGAGPTGLLLAGDLAAAGVPCTVLERRAGESNLTRAFGVHARTLGLLDARGLADELPGTGTTVDRLHVIGGAVLDLAWLPSRFPFMLITPQYHIERLLERRARARPTWSGPTACAARCAGRSGSASPGRSAVQSMMLADVRLSDAPARRCRSPRAPSASRSSRRSATAGIG